VKILVYGAGNIGCLYAARLCESGNDVSVLARGKRLAAIRARAIVLKDGRTGERTSARVKAVEELLAEDPYDLIIVALPWVRVPEVLRCLAANQKTPAVMFFGNNAAGARDVTDALGRERVLLGFPGAAGVHEDNAIRYLVLSKREQPTTVGEVDGSRSKRVEAIADTLRVAGFPIAICSNMDAWLKTHAMEIVPTACALYMAGGDRMHLAKNEEALRLLIRATREGHRVLRSLGVPVTPAIHRVFEWLPERLLVFVIRRMLRSEDAAIKIGHADSARDEMKFLGDDVRRLARRSAVVTPAMDRLSAYLTTS